MNARHLRAARSALLAMMLLGTAAPTGSALEAISETPSATRPYFACPPVKPHAPRCTTIVVPRSPLSAPGVRVVPAGGSGVLGDLAPADLQSAYRLPSSTNGGGQTVAVVYFADDPNAESDLAVYRSQYRLPACTTANGCFKKVNESGAEGPYPPATRSGATEISLDLDMVSATCPNCHIILVEANERNLLPAISRAPGFGATVIANSWTYTSEFAREAENDRYLQIPRVPITFPTYESSRAEATAYPAASPYVIAVGGTTLERAENARGWTESAWEQTIAACSAYEPKPLWQTDGGCRRRMYADVSAVAVGLSVYDTYLSSGWQTQNGTSASSPIVAGALALAEEGTRQRGAGAFYDDPSGLFDITTGRARSCEPTYFCNAGRGYDGPTGLGTPNGAPQVTPPTEPASSSIWALRDTTDDQYLYANTAGAITQASWTPLTGWFFAELVGGSIAAESLPTAVRDSSGDQWVYYVDRATSTIAYFAFTPREGWRTTVLGGTAAEAGSSPTAVRDAATGNQYVYYVARGGAITSWTLEARTGWVNRTIGGTAAVNSRPTVIRDPATGFQNVFYIDARERSLAAFGGTPPGTWSNMIFGGRLAAAGSSPAAVINTTSRKEYVYYVATESAIALWSWESSSGWLNNAVGGSAAANTSPSVVMDSATTITNVFYVDSRERALAAFGGTPPRNWANQIFGGRASINTSPVGIRDSSTGANWLWYTDSITGHRAYWAWSFAAGWSGFIL
jgi:hypothetical protein